MLKGVKDHKPDLQKKLFEKFYEQWDRQVVHSIPGYTILLMVPGDLPVFLKIAMEVCATQNAEHLVETLVIPDKLTHGFPELLEHLARNYSISPIRLVSLKPFDQLIIRYHNNPHINNWLQIVRGVEAVRSTYALWHDADLFITETDFLKVHYETCVERNLSYLGVSKAWDMWYETQGINHITSTWELIFNVEWFRSFSPLEHHGHDGLIAGKPHNFDITFLPQCLTPPDRVGRSQHKTGFIHFNYVICTYRWFQQSKGSFEDEHFRLLLIRLLINAYDQSEWPYEVPSLDDLIKGISNCSNRVTYLQERTKNHYPRFRFKLQRLIDSGLLDGEKVSILQDGIRTFDKTFGRR